MHDLQ